MMTAEDKIIAALWRWLLLFLTAAVVLFALGCCAFAHDHNRPGLDSWYSGLRSKNGLCCGGPSVDATTLDGPDWDTKDGRYRVRLNGEWHDVPLDSVLTEPNKDGRALVWPITDEDGSITIRCFMPGMMT